MRASFIKPRQKSIFRRDTKFWLIFTAITTGALTALFVVLQIEVYNVKSGIEKAIVDKKRMNEETVKAEHNYEKLKKELSASLAFKSSNVLLRENMANLLAIIPDEVTLTKMEISNEALTLYGETGSKEIYNLHLTPALKSIFTTSETSFAATPTGVRFISVNKLEKRETEDAGE